MSRKKVTMELVELQEPDVSFVSLVGRGAMRAPIKIIKSEDTPMDLASLFGFRSKATKTEEKVSPEVVAFVVKTDEVDQMIPAIEAQGHVILTRKEEGEVTTLFLQDDVDMDNTTIFKSNEHVATVCKGFSGWPEGTDFSENLKQAGFYPSVRMASDVMMDTLYNVLYEAEGPATEQINKVADDFASYVKTLAAALPVTAFKAEELKPVITEVKPETPAEDAVETPAEGGEVVKDSQEEPVETPAEDATDEVQKTDGVTPNEPTPDPAEGLKEMLTSMQAALTQKLEEVQGQLEGVKTTAEEAKALSQKATEQAIKAEEAVTGVVISSDSDDMRSTPVKKSERSIFDDVLVFDSFEQ